MIWRFGKHQLSDVVKIQQFLEKEGIEHELLLGDVDIRVGGGETVAEAPVAPITPPRAPAEPANPAWEFPSVHDGKTCHDRTCNDATHMFRSVE